MLFIFTYATDISTHINLFLDVDLKSLLPLIQTLHNYVSKDVRIRSYFSKPKGVREKKFLETLNEALQTKYLSLGTRFCELPLCFCLWEICVLLHSFNCCGPEYTNNNLRYTLSSSCSWYINKRMSGFQPLVSEALPTLFRHSILWWRVVTIAIGVYTTRQDVAESNATLMLI
jgi:hypothetical protein